MAYQYLTPENVIEVFKTSRQYTEGLTDNFPENERIMRNKPHASVPKEYPKTTDGTTASIIRKTPHRIIQQLPTGKVTSTTDDWLSVIAEFVYYDRIIPHANEGYALFQKCCQVIERFLGFGACPTYAPFVQQHGYFCTDLRLPYWGDVFFQPGKISDSDSNYVFLRSWWQSKDIEALIDSQEKLDKDTERTWNVENLRQIKDLVATKDEKAKTVHEKELNVDTKGGVELITGFQRGVKSKFFTFHVTSGLIVRTKENKDPRGEIPVSFAYGDIDGANPWGRSIIDLVGSLQNLMDAEMQMYQYNRALMLNPPLIKRGNFNKNKVKFAPNVIIDVGSDVNANIEPLSIDNTALQNFPNTYGLMQSQLFQLLSTPGSTISAEVGSISQSKTPQGVEQNKANLNIDDNYIRKQFETWFERWSETAINLYFAERKGVEELQLDKKTVRKLQVLAEQGRFDMNMVNENMEIRIDYDTATPALKFEVDASSSKKQDEIAQLQSYQGIVELLDKSEFLQGIIPPQKQMALYNSIITTSGVEDQEKLIVTEEELQEILQAKQGQDDIRDEIITNYKDAPEDIKRQIEAKNGFQPSQMMSPGQQMIDAKAQESAAPEGDMQQGGPAPADVLAVHKQAHDEQMDKAKLALEAKKLEIQAKGVDNQAQAAKAAAKKPVPKAKPKAKAK